MDRSDLQRAAAMAALVALLLAGLAIINRQPQTSDVQEAAPTERNPLAAELARCSGIGEAGARDPSCLRTWAENRRRFLGRPPSEAVPGSPAPTTLFPGKSNATDPAASAPHPAPAEAH